MRYALGLSAIGIGMLLMFAGYRDESALAIFVNAIGGDLDRKPHETDLIVTPTSLPNVAPTPMPGNTTGRVWA